MAMSIERAEDGVVNNLENKLSDDHLEEEVSKKSFFAKWGLLMMNVSCSAVGYIGGPLIIRLYFLHGGSRKWLSSWLQTAGFPILLIPLTYLYLRDQWKFKSPGSKFFANPLLLACAAAIGLLTGLNNFLYSYGLSFLPVSTSTLLLSTQLAFTALFAFVMCKQKLTPYSINAVVLMTSGAILLGISKSGDRPEGVTSSQYLLGFILSIGAAVIGGFMLPSVELTYAKTSKTMTFPIVLQFQFCMSMFATLFCTIGMIVNKDFSAMQREANAFDLGATKYYLVLVSSAVVWQVLFIGSLGLVFCVSSLFSGIITATFLPMTEVAAVFFFSEKFTGEKGLSLALGVWGFTSYFYGSYMQIKKQQSVLNQSTTINADQEATVSTQSKYHHQTE